MNDTALSTRDAARLTLAERRAGDERLARLVSRGRAHAFAVLYERHHRALSSYCRSLLRNEQDAQDALQTAMMRALAALQAGERELAVRPWLFRIVHNEAISLLRRRRLDIEPIDEQEPSRFDVERTFEQRERLATLVADLATLAERQRAALVMRELSGLSIEEIAAVLETSPGAAKQIVFEARRALHEIAEGRAMACEEIQRTISDRDGRMLRGRKVRAHLRACESCRAFQTSIEGRGAELRALAPPLPAAAAGALLTRLFAHGGGHGGSSAGTGSAAALGGHATASLAVKALIAVAVAGVAGGGVQLATHAGGGSRAAAHVSTATAHGAPSAGRSAPAGLAAPVVRSSPAVASAGAPHATAVPDPAAATAGPTPAAVPAPATGSPHAPRTSARSNGRSRVSPVPGRGSHAAPRVPLPHRPPPSHAQQRAPSHAPQHGPPADTGRPGPTPAQPSHPPAPHDGPQQSGGSPAAQSGANPGRGTPPSTPRPH